MVNISLPDRFIIDLDSKPTHWTNLSVLCEELGLKGKVSSNYEKILQYFPEEERHNLGKTTSGTTKIKFVVDNTKENYLKWKLRQGATLSNNVSGAMANNDFLPSRGEYKEASENGDPVEFNDKLAVVIDAFEVHLTYPTHINMEEIINYHRKLLNTVNIIIWKYSIVHEKGGKNGSLYNHTHLYMLFNKNLKCSNISFFNYKDKHPHISIPRKVPTKCSSRLIKGSGAYIACVYHRKDKDADRMSDYPICTEPIYQKPTKDIKLEDCRIIGYKPTLQLINETKNTIDSYLIEMQAPNPDELKVTKIMMMTEMIQDTAPSKDISELKKLYSWQKTVAGIAKNDITKRTIMWIYDKAGGNGKNAFSEHLAAKENAILINPAGQGDSMRQLTFNAVKANPKPSYIVFNLVLSDTHRDEERQLDEVDVLYDEEIHKVEEEQCYNSKALYGILEELRDGNVVSPKYKSINISINSVPIIVMSNKRPNMVRLVENRWIVCSLSFNKTIDMIAAGSYGKLAVDTYGECLQSMGRSLPPVLDITEDNILEATALLSYKVRSFYWERGLQPVFKLEKVERTTIEPSIVDDLGIMGLNIGKAKKSITIKMDSRPFTEEERKLYALRKKCNTEHMELTMQNEPKYKGKAIRMLETIYDEYEDGDNILCPIARSYMREVKKINIPDSPL